MAILHRRVKAHSESDTKITGTARKMEMTIDEPESSGGHNAAPMPTEYLLMALAGCLNASGRAVAEKMGIAVRAVDIEVMGEIDTEADGHYTYFQKVDAKIHADSDATPEQMAEWLARTEKACTVSHALRFPLPVNVRLAD